MASLDSTIDVIGIKVTLHDLFAGMAMQGIITRSNVIQPSSEGRKTETTFEEVATYAYVLADAMIAERNKRKETNEHEDGTSDPV